MDTFDRLYITKYQGTETNVIDSGAVKFTIPDLDSEITGWYQYLLPSGDFSIEVDISDYVKNHGTWGEFVELVVSDGISSRPETDGGVSDWATSIYLMDGSSHYTKMRYKDNGVYTNGASHSRASAPTKLRVRRDGTTIYADYYIAGWSNDASHDFGARAGNLTILGIALADRENKGGSVKFDNLTFTENCPSGYPKSWTTTSSTTTSTTTTTV